MWVEIFHVCFYAHTQCMHLSHIVQCMSATCKELNILVGRPELPKLKQGSFAVCQENKTT